MHYLLFGLEKTDVWLRKILRDLSFSHGLWVLLHMLFIHTHTHVFMDTDTTQCWVSAVLKAECGICCLVRFEIWFYRTEISFCFHMTAVTEICSTVHPCYFCSLTYVCFHANCHWYFSTPCWIINSETISTPPMNLKISVLLGILSRLAFAGPDIHCCEAEILLI